MLNQSVHIIHLKNVQYAVIQIKRIEKPQEEFECIECGHKSNADINVAINIKNCLTVLDGLFIATTKINDDSFKTNHHVNYIY